MSVLNCYIIWVGEVRGVRLVFALSLVSPAPAGSGRSYRLKRDFILAPAIRNRTGGTASLAVGWTRNWSVEGSRERRSSL